MTLDLRGLKCPLPVLRTRKALRGLAAGQELRVLSDDPLAGVDLPHMVAQDGHDLVETHKEDGISVFLVRKR